MIICSSWWGGILRRTTCLVSSSYSCWIVITGYNFGWKGSLVGTKSWICGRGLCRTLQNTRTANILSWEIFITKSFLERGASGLRNGAKILTYLWVHILFSLRLAGTLPDSLSCQRQNLEKLQNLRSSRFQNNLKVSISISLTPTKPARNHS
jgi:hypothetical protein